MENSKKKKYPPMGPFETNNSYVNIAGGAKPPSVIVQVFEQADNVTQRGFPAMGPSEVYNPHVNYPKGYTAPTGKTGMHNDDI